LLWENGKIVYEKYAHGFNEKHPHLLWSATKSVAATLIGLAIKDEQIDLSDKASKYYPLLRTSTHQDITVQNLLNMSSGISWKETYENDPWTSDVISMLYWKGFSDMASYTASKKMEHTPGSFFYYSSGETNLLMAVLQGALGAQKYKRYPWTHLFDQLDIKSATWEKDNAGNFIGSSYLYLTPRDFVKIGQLYLQNGQWQGKQLLPESWVKFSTTPAAAAVDESYGGHWYMNNKIPKDGKRPYPNAPHDVYLALGHHGQMLFVIPSQKRIFIRFGADKAGAISLDMIFKLIGEGSI
jgi:CubicO group peptidase (beta-lactamase class C family)